MARRPPTGRMNSATRRKHGRHPFEWAISVRYAGVLILFERLEGMPRGGEFDSMARMRLKLRLGGCSLESAGMKEVSTKRCIDARLA
jgi:hypothetical protein